LDADTLAEVTKLAQAVGVSGAAALILAFGSALHMPKLAQTFRGILQDWHKARLDRIKIEHQIRHDTAAIALEIDKKRSQTKKLLEGTKP
jgi:hypothetical protein